MAAKQRSDIFRSLLRSITGNNDGIGEKPINEAVPIFPQYKIIRRLGKGGMATVFHAEKTNTGRQVAIKVIADQISDHTDWFERFLIEAKNLAHLSHSNIVPVFDWGSHQGKSYIEMELMKGGDLINWFRFNPPTVGDALKITRQIASGLDFAGEKGFVHRDIKPDNILFREDGTPCISDFGIAKKISSDTTISGQGIVIGTGAYISPEQANPQGRKLDQRSDLYSLGILFYEMLTGEKPFEFTDGSPQECFFMYLNAHINLTPPSLPDHLSFLQPILNKLLAKDPENRFYRGQVLAEALFDQEKSLAPEILHQPLPGFSKKPDEPAGEDLATRQHSFPREQTLVEVTEAEKNKNNPMAWVFVILIGLPAITGSVWYFGYKDFTSSSQIVGLLFNQEQKETKPSVSSNKPETKLKVTPQISSSETLVEPDQPTIKETTPVEKVATVADPLKDLLEEVNEFKPSNPNQIAEQKRHITIYKKILELSPGNALATKELNRILESQTRHLEQKLKSNQFKGLDESLDIISLINAERGNNLSKAIASKKKRSRINKELEEIDRLIADATDTSSTSRNKLISALSLLKQAERAGAGNDEISILNNKINNKFVNAINTNINSGNPLSANRARQWLTVIDQTTTPSEKINILQSSFDSLKTALAREARQIEQKRKISALETKLQSNIEAANDYKPTSQSNLIQAHETLNRAVSQGLTINKSAAYRKKINEKFVLIVKKEITKIAAGGESSAKIWLDSADKVGVPPVTIKSLNQEYGEALAALETRKKPEPKSKFNWLFKKNDNDKKRVEATIPTI